MKSEEFSRNNVNLRHTIHGAKRFFTLHSSLFTLLLLFTLHSSLFIFTSCGDIESEYSNRRAFLRLERANMNTALAPAIAGISTNVFCRIYLSATNQLTCQNNQGITEVRTLTSIEAQQPLILGINNATGIIVGYGFDGVLFCYDACCSNCYNNGKELHLVSMNTNGIATCSHCNRQYDLTNHGLSPQGGRLEHYFASCSGQPAVLVVNNHYY